MQIRDCKSRTVARQARGLRVHFGSSSSTKSGIFVVWKGANVYSKFESSIVPYLF